MENEIKIDFRDKKPVTEQIHAEMRQRIERGLLAPGDRLPTVRRLADQLKVNFNTVARAYRLLDQEGLITARQGRGTFVVESGVQSEGESQKEASERSSPTPDVAGSTSAEVSSVAGEMPEGTKAKKLERVAALVREETERAGLSLDEVLAFLNAAPHKPVAKNRRRIDQRGRKKTTSTTAIRRHLKPNASLTVETKKQSRRKRHEKARSKS